MSFLIENLLLPYMKDNIFILIIYTIVVLITYTIGSIGISKSFTHFLNSKYNKNDKFLKDIYNVIKCRSMMGWVYIIIILSLTYSIFINLKYYIQSYIVLDIITITKNLVVLNIFKQLTEKYKEIEESDIVWLVTASYWATRIFLIYIFESVLPFIVTFIIILIFLSYKNVYLLLLSVIHIIIIILYIYLNFNKTVNLIEIQDKNHRSNMNILGDKVKNILNIIFDNTLNDEVEYMKDTHLIYTESAKKLLNNNNKILSISNLLNYMYVIFIFIFIYINNGYISTENITIIVMMLIIYISIVNNFIKETIDVSLYIYKIKALDELLTKEETSTCENINKFYKIKLINVYFKYENKYVLNNLNITFEPKKINVIMGKSGSGKTTLMKLFIKMYNVDKGDIYLDDHNINDICINDIRNNIYYVNQRTILFNKTIMYNMKYGNNYTDNKIIEILEEYKLIDYFNLIDKGLYSKTGVNGSKISLGMQKIIMIIRGILKENKTILIFDEPLTSLDIITRKKIVRLITEKTKDKTVIIISHDKEIIPHADNIIHLT